MCSAHALRTRNGDAELVSERDEYQPGIVSRFRYARQKTTEVGSARVGRELPSILVAPGFFKAVWFPLLPQEERCCRSNCVPVCGSWC